MQSGAFQLLALDCFVPIITTNGWTTISKSMGGFQVTPPLPIGSGYAEAICRQVPPQLSASKPPGE